MLSVNQVHFHYKKGQTVLKDINFTIESGQFVAIVGANGSGKSTIAKLLNGLLLPTEGTVKFDSLDTSRPADLIQIHEQIGLIFQHPEDQFITTTVKDEVLFGLENIRVPREEMQDRLMHALQAVQMEAYLEAMPHELSGGQQQRVAIASILAMRPRIIIFDEATSMLDPQGREQILSILHELHGQGMTIIHITHHMEEVLSVDRLILLHQGMVEFDGDPITFFETMSVNEYQLQLPFAVKLHHKLRLTSPLHTDWKEMITSQWSTNFKM